MDRLNDGSNAPYIPPEIVRHGALALNRAAARTTRGLRTASIFGADAHELIRRHGSPLQVYSEATMRGRSQEARAAFREIYPRVKMCWSYKTCALPAICAIFHDEGAEAEVVSGNEYELARELGVPGRRIVFNGPAKTDDDLRRAVADGARVNLDSIEEVDRLDALVGDRNGSGPLKVGLRINSLQGADPWTKFGVNVETGAARAAVERIHASGRLVLAGLHMHLGTFILDATAYARAMRTLIEVAIEAEARHDIEIETIDIGGGFASRNTLAQQMLPGDVSNPSLEVYAAQAMAPLVAELPRLRARPWILIEAGRALVDDAGAMLTSVVATKRLANGRRAVIVDAGVNVLPTAWWYRHRIEAVSADEATAEPVDILGPLCMQIDALRLGVELPPLRRGSLLVVHDTGAYNVGQSMQFIFPRPAVVLVTRSGAVEIIRERETPRDLRRLDRLPEGLAEAARRRLEEEGR